MSNGKPTYSSSCFTQGPIPYPAYSGDQIYVLESAANSNYNALQASFLHRFAAGLNANVNYTWSHILNNGSPQGEGGYRPVECVRDGCLMDSGNGTPIPVNSFLQYDYGNGDLDVRQRFTVMLELHPAVRQITARRGRVSGQRLERQYDLRLLHGLADQHQRTRRRASGNHHQCQRHTRLPRWRRP